MIKSFWIFLILILLNTFVNSYASELNGPTFWTGLKTSFTYLGQGSYLQFKEKNNLYYLSAALPALVFSFDQDKRISDNARTKKIPKAIQLSGDLAPLLGLPLISFASFSYGVKHDDPKLIAFSQEYFAAMYLAFIESAIISLVPGHERPSTAKLAKVETSLRGKSSFPSGHVIPYATWAFKTFQFYGPYWAIAPTALTILTSIQRVRDGKHYLSDVVGGFFLSAFASEGVRRAGQYDQNDSRYKYLFERNMTVGLIEHDGALGPRFSFDW